MSLLYECINGIIEGGILDGSSTLQEGEDVAALCVDKLRGMVAVEGDPNCKFSMESTQEDSTDPCSEIRSITRFS